TLPQPEFRTVILILRSGVFAASRRMKAVYGLMVRDSASAPPHHEGRQLLQHHPSRRMVAGAFLAAHFPVDAGLKQARGQRRAEQEMIEPQAGVARPAVALVIPEREHRLFRMQLADRV